MDMLCSYLSSLPASFYHCAQRATFLNDENVHKICKVAILNLNNMGNFLVEHPGVLAMALPFIVSAGTPRDCQYTCQKILGNNSSGYWACVSACIKSPYNATEVHGWCVEMCAQEPTLDPKECIEMLFRFFMKNYVQRQ
jgi:hypothetical protein